MQVFRDLDADVVRGEVLPATSRGVSDDTINAFLDEREAFVKGYFGGVLPDRGDIVVRGIIRDLAGAASWYKIAQTDEDRRAAAALQKDAMDRLKLYPKPDVLNADTLVVSVEDFD